MKLSKLFKRKSNNTEDTSSNSSSNNSSADTSPSVHASNLDINFLYSPRTTSGSNNHSNNKRNSKAFKTIFNSNPDQDESKNDFAKLNNSAVNVVYKKNPISYTCQHDNGKILFLPKVDVKVKMQDQILNVKAGQLYCLSTCHREEYNFNEYPQDILKRWKQQYYEFILLFLDSKETCLKIPSLQQVYFLHDIIQLVISVPNEEQTYFPLCIHTCRNAFPLQLLFATQIECHSFVAMILFLISQDETVQSILNDDLLIYKQFVMADESSDNSVDVQECKQWMKQIHVPHSLSKKVLKKNGEWDYNEFKQLYSHLVCKKQELESVFKKYAQTSIVNSKKWEHYSMDMNQWQLFCTMEQQYSVIPTWDHSSSSSSNASFEQFCSLISAQVIHNNYKQMEQVEHLMHYPLSYYFINGSHNTYLTGNQLSSISSVEMYRKVLWEGSKCLEIDIWDGENEEPITTHGHTMCSKILFRDVILCINEHAFDVSPYPLILSLEIHTSIVQQEKMAEYMIQIFGDKLFTLDSFEELKQRENLNGEYLPSPSQLKHKIILKGKKINTTTSTSSVSAVVVEGQQQQQDETLLQLEEEEEEESSTATATVTNSFSQTNITTPTESKKKIKIAKLLSDITFLTTVSLHSWDNSSSKPCWMMHSMSESKQSKLMKRDSLACVTFNKRQFTRVYPKGTRFNSSNFSPMEPWYMGSQMVCLNSQTVDRNKRINNCKFEEFANMGYILKPMSMCELQSEYNPTTQDQIQCDIHLQVLSAQCLPHQGNTEAHMDPYVVLELIGNSKESNKWNTKVVKNNGFNPIWNEQFIIPVCNPELAMLRVAVMDKEKSSQDVLLCENYFTVSFLKSKGYYSVPMKSLHSNYYQQVIENCHVLVHIQIKNRV